MNANVHNVLYRIYLLDTNLAKIFKNRNEKNKYAPQNQKNRYGTNQKSYHILRQKQFSSQMHQFSLG